ncbi:major facilitator superfamily domain-containing protein [Sphaerosporella brunnea]|uniref:Probable transporter MCH1 n=1 Tax=Sphaerosporella brunnea TaxID=1250544 RepID=A0A5J5EPM8_9PEZI|nr:major facilitator superfamily domain-containing protein [Sphaerosporella brunnea]
MAHTDAISEVHETSPLLPRSSAAPSNTKILLSWRPRRSTLALLTALINCLWAGSVLIFSLYAPLFNTHLGYRQMQINAVSVATELGMYLPVPMFGFVCDRYGPSRLSLLCTAFFGPGYALAALAYARQWDYKIMVVAFALVGAGTSSMYFSGVTTCAKNFTGRRGLALAMPIAAFGLSSLWQAQLVSRVFTTAEGVLRVEKVFLFFSVSLVAVGLWGSVGLHLEPEETQLLEDEEEDDEKGWVNADTRAFLKDRTMWAFATGVFLVTGPGEAFINNMGTLIQTLRPSPSAASTVDSATQVSLIALTSTFARLIAGSVSDYLAPLAPTSHLPPRPRTHKQRFTCSRMSILFFFAGLMLVGFLLVASGRIHESPDLFWMVSSSIGAGYGAVFCLAPTVVSVVWGTKNFGTNWGIVTMTPALGAVLYGCLFAAEFDGGVKEGETACIGLHCARYSFAAMAASVVAAVLGWAAVWRTWRQRGVVV